MLRSFRATQLTTTAERGGVSQKTLLGAILHGRQSRSLADDPLKRILDICGALFGLVFLGPLLIACAAAIKVTSRGPVFYLQPRYGRDGKIFWIFKFRTMATAPRSHAELGCIHDHAARTTFVGHRLRRHCIDELPQLINVLKGDMSLVGPRAHPVGLHVKGVLYEDLAPNYHSRHLLRPGISGLAQVMGFRGVIDTVAHAITRLEYDQIYIAHRTMTLDLCIIGFSLCFFLVGGGYKATKFPLQWFLPAAQAFGNGETVAEPNRSLANRLLRPGG